MRSAFLLACLIAVPLSSAVSAGEAAVPAGPETPRTPRGTAPVKRPTALELIAEEEKWTFRAPLNRPDVFVDLEAQLLAQNQAKIKDNAAKHEKPIGVIGDQPQGSDIDQLISWAKGEEDRIRRMVTARRYEEAMKAADAALTSSASGPTEPRPRRPRSAMTPRPPSKRSRSRSSACCGRRTACAWPSSMARTALSRSMTGSRTAR